MDPVQVIGLLASVSTLIHASRSLLRTVKAFKEGDQDLLELSNDVSVFAEALAGFERVLRSRQTIHRISGPVIENVLQNSLRTINDLENRVSQVYSSEVSAVRRMKWVQQASSIKKIHHRLKEQNVMLQTFLSITHAETFLAVASQHPQYMSFCSLVDETMAGDERSEHTRQVSPQENELRRSPSASSLATVSTTTETTSLMESLSLASSNTSYESLGSLSRRTSEDKAASSAVNGSYSQHNSSSIGPSTALISARETTDSLYGMSAAFGRDENQLHSVVRQSCRYNCHCKCHEQNTQKASKRFAKLKSVKVLCTDATCKISLAAEERFDAQSNYFRKALSQVLSWKSVKVRYDLHTYRMVSEGAIAIRYVKHGNLDKLKACFDSGEATIWDTAPDGWSLLHTAAYHRQLPIVKYLMELGVDTEAGDIGSRKPADLAVLKSMGQDATQVERDIVEVFSQKDDCLSDFEFTPIHIAVLDMYDARDLERPSLEALIQVVDDANNAPVNTDWAQWKSRYKTRSPLFVAIIEYFRASAFEKPKGTKIICNLLDQKDSRYCWTPLHWAAMAGKVDKMEILVNHGANPLLLSNLNFNILHAAAESKISRGLAGALAIWKRFPEDLNINQANKWGETPLHIASWGSPACIKLLIEAGADPDVRQEDGQVPLHCAGLSERGPEKREMVSLLCSTRDKNHINVQDIDGRPPIFDFLDDAECIEILIHHGARLDLTDTSGKNVFHHACIQDEDRALRTMLRLAHDKILATVNDDEGNTPLMEALCNSSVECALMLLELEDVGNILSKDGWAAVHYAAKIGDADLLEAVFKHPSFMKHMKTLDGKSVEVVAMEAGTWSGKVKELVRKYDSFG